MIPIRHLAIVIAGICFFISAKPLSAEQGFKPDYPENYVSVMPHWISRGDLKLTRNELFRKLELIPEGHNNFRHRVELVLYTLEKIEDLYNIYGRISHEEFALALSDIAAYRSFAERVTAHVLEFPTEVAIDQALASEYITENGEAAKFHFPPKVGDYTRYFISDLGFFATRIHSDLHYIQYFVLDMLAAEAYFRLGAYEEAEMKYKEKLDEVEELKAANKDVEWLLRGKLLSQSERDADPQIQSVNSKLLMIKIRLALTYLAWGDRYFKGAQGLSPISRQEALNLAKEKYEKALALFPDTYIGTQIDKKIGALDSMEFKLKDEINKPEFILETPLELRSPIEIPKKSSVFARPFTVTRLVPSTVERMTVETVEPNLQREQTWEKVVREIYREKGVQRAESKRQPTVQSERAGIELKYKPVTIVPTYPLEVVPRENPLIIQIVCHAKMQLLKIRRGLNYLGYTDGYVPAQRYSALYGHANEYADLSIQAENRYIQFKREAEEQEYQSMQLGQNLEISSYQAEIARTRQAIAVDRQEQAEARMKAIDKKIDSIKSSNVWGFLGDIVQFTAGIVGAPFTGGASLTLTAHGAYSFAGRMTQQVSSNDEIAALQYEKRAVAIDKAIAAKEGLIAEIEEKIGNMQQMFMIENMNYLALKEMNQELYYALASTLKQIKTKYLEAGVRMGFLAERALAFEMGESDLQFIKFEYEVSALKGLLAGDFLKQDLEMMEFNRTLSLKQRNHVKYVISLRQRYPMEFYGFLQTGVMTFATGLYDFDKAYPGTYQRRLKRVEVIIQGAVGPEGFKGSLTNFGSFVVRQNQSEINRLIPTEKAIHDAYKNLQSKGLSILPVGGLNAFTLPPARLILSRYEIRQDQVIFPTEPEVREIFEGFGVAGLWRLELPKNVNDADYRTIADAKLVLYFDALYDPALEARIGGYYDDQGRWVEGLVQKYEKEVTGGAELDQFAGFSLRQHFPDEYFSLAEGKIEVELLDGDFPLYMKEKKVKKVMLLALDREGKGVQGIELSIAKLPDTLSIEAETNADGFAIDSKDYMNPNEDAVLPRNKRVPVVGGWSITLKDAGQVGKIDDLVVFFMYEYKEKRGTPTP